jgi:hypothetical protein
MSTTPNKDHGTAHKSSAEPMKSNTAPAATPAKTPVSGHEAGKSAPLPQGTKPQDASKSANHR